MNKNKKYNPSIHDCVYMIMKHGHWWTTYELRERILHAFKKSYDETGLSAAMRDMRKLPFREKYRLDLTGEVLEKKRNVTGKGYRYKLIISEVNDAR